MGEASQRAHVYAKAKARLFSDVGAVADARVVAEVATALFERFVLPRRYIGGCYLTTMFLHRYLLAERGISTDPVLGYVNDGTDDIMISHAWIEHNGRKVDVTLHLTDPRQSLSGDLIVLDHLLRRGAATYSYHRDLTPAGLAAYQEMERAGGFPAQLLRHKQAEHRLMSETMLDCDAMARHQASAPPGLHYSDMRSALA